MVRNKHQEDSNPGSDPGSNPGSDPGFILSLSRFRRRLRGKTVTEVWFTGVCDRLCSGKLVRIR